MFHKKTKLFSTTRIIAFGFLGGIIIGTILLSLPIATKDRSITPLVDAAFTATTSLCVTGLTTVTTANHWSLFGQAIILFLIQFGGLGIITFTTTIMLLLGKRITLTDRLLIQESYNLDTLSGLVKMAKKVIMGTLIVEGIGAVFYSFQFIPEYGPMKGLWYSVFHSISAFCNAGIDLIGDSSFVPYLDNILINVVTMSLIILGGLGFPVWWDFIKISKQAAKKEISKKQIFSRLSVHSKLVITVSFIMIVAGAIITFLLEYNNPDTLGNLSIGNKALASLFQSVTTRTAGFATIPQENFLHATSIIYLIWMFIGGSPSGTAGGIKTVTIAVILLSTVSIVKGKKDVEVFRRKISDQYLKKALAVFVVSTVTMLIMTIVLTAVQDSLFLDTIFEVTSSIATVGLTRNMTGSLNDVGKTIIMIAMYLGRIGPITMALAFNINRSHGEKSLPEGRLLVG